MAFLNKSALKNGFEAALIPLGLYLLLAPVIAAFGVVGGMIADRGHAGGEAVGLTFMANVFDVIPTVYLIVSFWFLIQLKQLNRVGITLNGLIFILAAWVIIYFYREKNKEVYSMQADTIIHGSDTLRVEREYYYGKIDNSKTDTIRSIKHWCNSKPDSIWVTYDRKGKLIEKERY